MTKRRLGPSGRKSAAGPDAAGTDQDRAEAVDVTRNAVLLEFQLELFETGRDEKAAYPIRSGRIHEDPGNGVDLSQMLGGFWWPCCCAMLGS